MEGSTSACKVWHAYGWISHFRLSALVSSSDKHHKDHIFVHLLHSTPLYIALFGHILLQKFMIFSVTLKKDTAVLLFKTTNN